MTYLYAIEFTYSDGDKFSEDVYLTHEQANEISQLLNALSLTNDICDVQVYQPNRPYNYLEFMKILRPKGLLR